MTRFAKFAVVTLLLSGCATVGRDVKEQDLASFERGKTTVGEVTAKLGPPTTSVVRADGGRIFIYSFAHAQARPETFIPFVGPFVGGSDVRSTGASLIFTPSGILSDYSHSSSKSAAGFGLSGGAYQEPNRELPKESK